MLEYGCGNGAVSAAFAPLAERYIGIDIDQLQVDVAERILAEQGLSPTLVVASPERVLEATAEFSGEIDVFLCYAVLEHLSVDERLTLLRLARDVVRPDGIIVVVETPNRLTPWDYHTSQLPFLNQVPDELALAYADRSTREEFTEALGQAAAQGPAALREAFVRWGRGMSYHELELVFDDLPACVLASSWEPVLLPERAVYRAELALDRILAAARPEMPPAFSRYWLDFILAPAPRPAPRRFLRPWQLRTTGSAGVAYTAHETIYMSDRDSMLAIDLPNPASRIVVGIEGAGEDELWIRLRTPDGSEEIEAQVQSTDDWASHAEITLSEPVGDLELRLSRPGTVGYVLHDA